MNRHNCQEKVNLDFQGSLLLALCGFREAEIYENRYNCCNRYSGE